MTKFSANLGFLWSDRPLPEAIHSAKAAGFDAVECHWPYATPASDVKAALDETGLAMLGINTQRGNVATGDNGLAALPKREIEARGAIDEALNYASEINARNVHVMAGFAKGEAAWRVFIENLRYATRQAANHNITIVIEPLNSYDAPGYFLSTTAQAAQIIDDVGAANLKLMFDCYHVQLMEGDLTHKLESLIDIIGHIQFASVPDRGRPDCGELSYAHIFRTIAELGYDAPLGAEYKSAQPTNETLGWMDKLRQV